MISGNTTSPAPASAARSVHSTISLALPSRSPTVGFTWASAILSVGTGQAYARAGPRNLPETPTRQTRPAQSHRGVEGEAVDRQQEFVLRTLDERDIRFVRLWFTDVLGYLKSVAVAPAELEGAFAEGIGFDGSSVEGFARVYESDMIARPDPSTFQLMPMGGGAVVGRMFCDIAMPDGSPSYADPRYVLK